MQYINIMNYLFTTFRNFTKTNVRYMSHSHYVILNYENLYKKYKELAHQQNITQQTINDMTKKMDLMEKKIIKLEKNKKR